MSLVKEATDADQFMMMANHGLELLRRNRLGSAVSLLAEAERIYASGGFEENTSPQAREVYGDVGRGLAAAAADWGDYDLAIRYFLRVLEADAHDGETHLALVATAARAGRHGEARRYYRLYVARMEQVAAPVAPFPGPGLVAPGGLSHPAL